MATLNELSTGVWQVTFTATEKATLQSAHAVDVQALKRIVEGFLVEKAELLIKSRGRLLATAYRNASAGRKDQIDKILGIPDRASSSGGRP